MNIVFRVDSSDMIGAGHVYRCLVLADLYSEKNNITFITKELSGNLIKIIEDKYPVERIKPETDEYLSGDHSTWLYGSLEYDLVQTIDVLERIHKNTGVVDWLIIDQYAIGPEWESRIRDYTKRILVIDDIIRKHDADFLINQYISRRDYSDYEKLLPDGCRLLGGYNYLLIDKKYLLTERKDSTELKRIAVALGTDPLNRTRDVIEICRNINNGAGNQLSFLIIVNQTHKHRDELKKLCESYQGFEFVSGVDLAVAYKDIDLCIGAVGVSSLERAAMRVPTITLVTPGKHFLLPLQSLIERNLIIRMDDPGDFETLHFMLTEILIHYKENYSKLSGLINCCRESITLSYLERLVGILY